MYADAVSTGLTDIYLAIPAFTFMALVLEFSGVATDLYDVMYKWMGRLRGGLAIGTVIISTIIAAMTGVGATAVFTVGALALPEMRKRNYAKSMSLGCIAFGGALGPLITPSVLMIIVGGLSSVSIGKMFLGGIIPGLLSAFLAIVYIAVICLFKPSLAPSLTAASRVTWREKEASLPRALPATLLILVILGSIYMGIATPTEAGSIGAVGALVFATVFHKLSWANLKSALLGTQKISVMCLWLLIGGRTFTSFLSFSEVGTFISNTLLGQSISPLGFLVATMVIGCVLGMFVDGASISMICLPIFLPIIKALGYDLLWFNLLWTINMITGYLTPPFGMNLFYLKAIAPSDVSMSDIFSSVWPYVGVFLVVIVLGVLFPEMITWLPNRLIK